MANQRGVMTLAITIILGLSGCGASGFSSTPTKEIVPSAFWRSYPVSQWRYAKIFPRQIGKRAAQIDHGGVNSQSRYKPYPGSATTELREPDVNDLAVVPEASSLRAWRSVVLMETWKWPSAQVLPNARVTGTASFIFVIDHNGRVLGERVVGDPPQLWK